MKIFINCSTSYHSKSVRPSLIFGNFGQFCEAMRILFVRKEACVVVLSKMVEDGNSEKNSWIKSLFLFSLCTKRILVASQNWSWATDVTWTVLPMSLFLGLGTFQLCCGLWRVRKLSDFIKNILICVPKMNEGILGNFGVNYPFKNS